MGQYRGTQNPKTEVVTTLQTENDSHFKKPLFQYTDSEFLDHDSTWSNETGSHKRSIRGHSIDLGIEDPRRRHNVYWLLWLVRH